MAGKRLTAQLHRRLGERDQIADAHQFRHFAQQQAGIDEQVCQRHWSIPLFLRQQVGRRLDNHAR